MKDRFETRSAGISASATDGFAITPDDATELNEITRAVFVGTSGDISVVLASSAELLFRNVGSGTVLPIRARLVRATGTSASDLLGLV